MGSTRLPSPLEACFNLHMDCDVFINFRLIWRLFLPYTRAKGISVSFDSVLTAPKMEFILLDRYINTLSLSFSLEQRIQLGSIHQRAPWCPLRVPNRSPFKAYHTFGMWSLEHENNRSPSLLYLICVIERSCPCNINGFCKVKEWKKCKKWSVHYSRTAAINGWLINPFTAHGNGWF